MSRKQKAASLPNPIAADAEGIKFLRGRDPDVMVPMLQLLAPRRAVFSWLTPGTPLIGLPSFVDQNMPWLAMIDDLAPGAAGPPSFDQASLEWWAAQAEVFFIDAATPKVRLYEMIGRFAAMGYLVLAVQTVEARRLVWHDYFVAVHPPGRPAQAIHQLKGTVPGGPEQVTRIGGLYDDFVSVRPIASKGTLKTTTFH